jgi:hypothetical protein
MERRPVFGLLYWLWMIDDDERVAIGGTIDRGNRNTRGKPGTVPPQIPQDLTRVQAQVAVV